MTESKILGMRTDMAAVVLVMLGMLVTGLFFVASVNATAEDALSRTEKHEEVISEIQKSIHNIEVHLASIDASITRDAEDINEIKGDLKEIKNKIHEGG